MEKRTLVAIVLSLAIIIFWQLIIVKPQLEKKKEIIRQQQMEAVKQVEKEKKESEVKELLKKEQQPEKKKTVIETFPSATDITIERSIKIKNKFYEVELTNVGGMISSWKLLDYFDKESNILQLINKKMRNRGYLPLGLLSDEKKELVSNINDARFKINDEIADDIDLNKAPEGKARIVLEYSDGKSNAIQKILTFKSDSRIVELEVYAMGEIVNTSYLLIGPGLENPEEVEGGSALLMTGAGYRVVIGKADGKADRIEEVEKDIHFPLKGINYLGIETMYFTSIFSRPVELAEDSAGETAEDSGEPKQIEGIIKQIKDPSFDKVEKAQAIAVGLKLQKSFKTDLFYGPKEYKLARELGFYGLVDFGFWEFLALPLLYFLNWIYSYLGNYGLAIIVLTIVLNLIFYPLRQKSFKSMEKMRELQPKIKNIKSKYEKYKKDIQKRQEMNQEIMELYRKENVSPTGGCLPLLLQFPVLIAMYRMLAIAIEMRQAPFILWITDLSIKDPYYITPLVMGLTMWLQNRFSPQAGGADPTANKMFKVLPIFFTLLFLNMPAGLVLYWLFNNVLSIGQQYLLRKKMEEEKMSQKGKLRRRN